VASAELMRGKDFFFVGESPCKDKWHFSLAEVFAIASAFLSAGFMAAWFLRGLR
jgi:hypothetical protein